MMQGRRITEEGRSNILEVIEKTKEGVHTWRTKGFKKETVNNFEDISKIDFYTEDEIKNSVIGRGIVGGLLLGGVGANQKPGETRLQLVERNTKIMQSIIQNIMKSGFDGIIVLASNPVDVLSYVAYKESGLPAGRVIGSGTTLDSARFRVLLGEYFEVDPRNVHATIIGEHGDSELPVFSQMSIGVETLENLLERRGNVSDKDNLKVIFEAVKNAAYEIINRKGVTNFGIGTCLVRITKAILNNEHSILPVSCLLTGEYGEQDVYASVPAIVGREGVREVIELKLNDEEKSLFKKSAEVLRKTRVK